jgi:hypothetical protein
MLIRVYLVVYFALVGAAVAALWQGDVIGRLPGEWVALALLLALGLGALLAFVSLRGRGGPTPA